MYLHEKLEEYEKYGCYPMHMPGHKRQLRGEPYACDITEIEGFDNLHHSEDILKHDRDRAAAFYGAGEARFLVNGSTCGVLAAISAVTEYGDTIIIGRNSHKSAYHALQLRGMKAEYVYPDESLYEGWSIDGPIPPEEVRRLLEGAAEERKNPEGSEKVPSPHEKSQKNSSLYDKTKTRRAQPKAVFLTSPTYEGVISDIKKIADICHEYGVPLIVDEAHGAHLKVMEAYGGELTVKEDAHSDEKNTEKEDRAVPETDGRKTENMKKTVSAVDAGADIVILGLHKTMPVLTQCALLTVSRDAIREGRVCVKTLDEYLGIYESSSPSYVLMGSISRCVHWLDGSFKIEGRTVREQVSEYQKNLAETRSRLSAMKHLRLFSPDRKETGKQWISMEKNPVIRYDYEKNPEISCDYEKNPEISFDPGKLVISTKGTGLTGEELAEFLREKYEIEIEMAQTDYIVAMTSMFDSKEGMRKFADALLACDDELDRKNSRKNRNSGLKEKKDESIIAGFPRAQAVMTIAEAVSFARCHPDEVREMELSSWSEENEISAEFIYVYPPGIPIVSPGEIITKGVAKKIICDYNSGCALIGCVESGGGPAVRCFEKPQGKGAVTIEECDR